jgi:hypothetical protein
VYRSSEMSLPYGGDSVRTFCLVYMGYPVERRLCSHRWFSRLQSRERRRDNRNRFIDNLNIALLATQGQSVKDKRESYQPDREKLYAAKLFSEVRQCRGELRLSNKAKYKTNAKGDNVSPISCEKKRGKMLTKLLSHKGSFYLQAWRLDRNHIRKAHGFAHWTSAFDLEIRRLLSVRFAFTFLQGSCSSSQQSMIRSFRCNVLQDMD